MAEIMEYKPELGGVEAHQALAKKRLDGAEEDYRRIVNNENLPADVKERAKLSIEEERAIYKAFVEGLPKDPEDPKAQIPENELH